MRPPRLLVTLLLLAGLPALGQTLSPAPQPGLWSLQWQTLVNGRDLHASMTEAMALMLQALPPAQRAQAEAMMQSRGGAIGQLMGGGPRQECLTAADAERLADPKRALAQMQRQAPQCRFEPAEVSGSTLRFKGRCEDPRGFSGDVQGEFTAVSAKQWTGRWGGKGRMAGAENLPPVLGVGADGAVDLQMQGGGRWLAASCGDVKPTPR